MSMKNQMDVGLHQSKYGYEVNNKVYKFKDVNNIYVQKRKNHSLKDILIQIQDTCKSEFNVNEKNDDNEEIFDVKRSEEHTSELQSRQYLVCRLLLEKKKHMKLLGRRLAKSGRRPVPLLHARPAPHRLPQRPHRAAR